MADFTGAAHNDFDVVDYSQVSSALVKGAACVQGITERGVPGKPVLIKSWADYRRNFGELLDFSVSYFPYLCYLILKRKCALFIAPAAHYTDVTDKTSFVGTPATAIIQSAPTGGVSSHATLTFTAGPSAPARGYIEYNSVVLAFFDVTGSESVTATAVLAKNAINAATSTNGGWTATNAAGILTLIAPVGLGATPNTTAFVFINPIPGVTFSQTAFTGGVTAISANIATFTATSSGTWANAKLTIQTKAAASGKAGYVDLFIGLAGFPELAQVVKNVPMAAVQADIDAANIQLTLMQLTSLTGTLIVGSAAFAGGARDASAIVTDDYIGDANGGTGIYCFDSVKLAVRIAVPEISDPLLDIALADYVDARKDMMAVLRTPLYLDGDTCVAYREGLSPYEHTPIDSWRTIMTTGGENINHPYTGLKYDITEVADALACMGNRDAGIVPTSGPAVDPPQPWFSMAGPQRGRVPGVNNVLVDFYAASRKSQFDNIDAHGIIPLVMHETYGATFWGNTTLWKTPQLIQDANIAELVLYIYRATKGAVDWQSFAPTDPTTWRKLNRDIMPILNDLQAKRAIRDKVYFGDQNAKKVPQDLVVNTADGLDAGIYKIKIFIKPITATKYIGFELALVNSSVNFNTVLQDTNNPTA